MKEAWFYEILFFQVIIIMVKDKKRCSFKGTMATKIVLCITGITLQAQSNVTSSFRGI